MTNYAQECTQFASPCRNVVTNSFAAEPVALDRCEVVGSESRDLGSNQDTTAYLTTFNLRKMLIVSHVFSLWPDFWPAKDFQSPLRKLIFVETVEGHEYRSKYIPERTQRAGSLIKYDGFIWRELLLGNRCSFTFFWFG